MDNYLEIRELVEQLICLRDWLDSRTDKDLLADACNYLDRYAELLRKMDKDND